MENERSDFITVDQIVKSIKRHKWVILICIIAGVSLAFVYNRITPALYKAPGIISFEQYSQDNMLQLGFESAQYQSNFIANRIKELKTRTFAELVFLELSDRVRQLFPLPEDLPQEFDLDRYIIRKIQEDLSAVQSESATSLLTISFSSQNPELARFITNTAIDVLKKSNLFERRQEFSNLRNFVDEQVEVVEQQLADAEQALKEFKSDRSIASLEDESREILTRITQAEVMQNQISSETRAKQTKLAVLQEKIDEQKQTIRTSVPETSNPIIDKLKEELVQLEVESTSLQVRGYAEDHPRVKKVNSDIEGVKERLGKLTLIILDQNLDGMIDPLSSLKNYIQEAKALEIEIKALLAQKKHVEETLASYNSRLKRLSDSDATLFGLLRDREVINKIYVNLLEEREQVRLQEAAEIGNMRIIERAQTPLAPFKPRKKLNLIIGFLVGSMLGLALVFLKDSTNHLIDKEEDVESLLDLPVLVSIQKIKNRWTIPLNGDSISSSHYIDAYKDVFARLWQSLHFLGVDKLRSVLVTSACPGEGKSTVAANLAITAAKMGQNVLLIDGDLRKPSLSRVLHVSKEATGLTDLVFTEKLADDLSGKKNVFPNVNATWDNEFMSTLVPRMKSALNNDLGVEGLNFLGAGTVRKFPAFIWASSDFMTELNTFMRDFDFVVIDTPPVLGIPDAASVGPYVDGAILVVASDQAEKPLILRARKLLAQTKTNIIGIVYNRVKSNQVYGKYQYRRYYEA